MIDTIKVLISAVAGGVVTGIFGVWLQRTKNRGTNESVYAEHTEDLFKRLDKITNERDDLKFQVIELKGQVKKLNGVIDSLNEQVGELTSKLDDFTKREEEK